MNRAIDKPKEQPLITMDATKLEDLGHFHVTGPEFWFVLEGRMEFRTGSI
jgi:mannose-6-phosphate isomerase-like protein (cupin superfamily)